MADTKYGNLVKTLPYQKGRGGANAKEMVFMQGKDLAGFDLNFIVGVYDETGDWAPGRGAHAHPFDELLLFFGYDDEDLSYLGSDMELSLGGELEKHYFSIPTVAAAPSDLPHCPLITKKVYKPFGHFHLALSPKYSGGGVETGGETDGHKYDYLVKPMEVKEGPGGADARQLITVSGEELQGFNIHYSMGLHNGTGEYYPGKGAHAHPFDEVYVFFGHDVSNLSYLGAELTMEIGKEGEKHAFDVPTAVSLPKGTPHCPIVCNKVERPYTLMRIGLAKKYEESPA